MYRPIFDKLEDIAEADRIHYKQETQSGSPNFGKWVSVHLSAENKRQAWIPPGFAHGFIVLSDVAEFLYKTTDYWYPQFERTLLWNDPAVGIDWQFDGKPLLAAKDQAGSPLSQADVFE